MLAVVRTWVEWSVASVTFLCVSEGLHVHALKVQQLELSTLDFVGVQCMAIGWWCFDSKVERSRLHGYQMRCHRGCACRQDCLGFVVESLLFEMTDVTAKSSTRWAAAERCGTETESCWTTSTWRRTDCMCCCRGTSVNEHERCDY